MSPARDRQDSVPLYRRLLGYALPYKAMFLVGVVGMVLMAATAGTFTALMKPLIDDGFVGRDAAAIRYLPFAIVGVFLMRGFANVLAEYGMSWVSQRVMFDLRNAIFQRLVALPTSFYEHNTTGKLISKIIFNVGQMAGIVTSTVLTLITDSLTVIVLFGWMLYLNWKLTLLFVVLLPITTAMLRYMSKRFRKTSHEIQASMGEISQVTQEAAEGQRVVKAYRGEAVALHAFAAANDRSRRQVMRKVAVSAIGMGLLQLVGAIGLAVVIYLALATGQISAGGFASYVSAAIWMMGPTRRLAKVNEQIQTGLAAAHSAFELLDEPIEDDSGTRELKQVRGDVEYQNVSYRYPGTDQEALRNVSFSIKAGQLVALVGASGSGKTTCASLLPRFYRVEQGALLLDDVNVNELKLANLRDQIALVGQEAILFDDTLRNNIAYGTRAPIDEARLQDAVRAAYVLEFAERLPDGLDTRVGERGSRLSGGQRQRVAIARALYKNAPILILDEATSALDTESERFVQSAMQQLMKGRSTLVIAHRLSTVEHADRIVVLAQGQVVETGTHAELLARDGVYAGLYRSQFNAPAN
ncbi:MAG: lipid A export permease/ATP-binding protein MsbA [Pseudomonadota bacterium]|nr:MAG: lipid A export permease/ATP-binding protein MsbA [Pseudomonadota bacterium]